MKPDATDRPGMVPRILKTPGVCGGGACVADTRIPVWLLVAFREHGASDATLLEYYPSLTAADLAAAWEYAAVNADEIAAAVRANDED